MREFSDDREPQFEPEPAEPRFGRLLLVLGLVILFIIALTFASAMWFA